MHKLIADEPYELSPDAARLVDEVNTAWDAAQELRGQLKIETERLAAIDPLKFKAADIQAKRKTREYTIKVLQLEIPLLVRLREWWQIRSRERHNAWTARLSAVMTRSKASATSSAKSGLMRMHSLRSRAKAV